jgi:MEMO1 family protein
MTAAAVHRSPFAGSWYPGNPAELQQLLDRLFEESSQRVPGPLQSGGAAFVVPHAGLVYSGKTAAAVYRHLAEARPRSVLLLGFAHRGAAPGLWIPDMTAYSTPLGEVPVDTDLRRRLLAGGAFREGVEESLCDHSIEIQLPLLQQASPGTQIVPIYVSHPGTDLRRRGAAELAALVGAETPLIASSDFTHYGDSFGYKPFPHDGQTSHRLRTLDESFIEAAGSINAAHLERTLKAESATVCGREPIGLLLETLRAAEGGDDIFQRTLDYETSGDITGDYSHCVSYAALGYFPWRSFQLSCEEGRLLIASAQATLHNLQQNGHAEPIPPAHISGALARGAGAFVTICQDGELRGCIGRITVEQPLADVVPRMAIAAATEDSRFKPIGADESGIEVEVSVLSPMKLLPDPEEFVVGRDGGYLDCGGRGGLLLPQVAEGRGWTSAEFLAALARKARVKPDVYADPATRLFTFRAQVIE